MCDVHVQISHLFTYMHVHAGYVPVTVPWLSQSDQSDFSIRGTEDCKLVVTCKCKIEMQLHDKLNQQCSKLALFANTITEICGG